MSMPESMFVLLQSLPHNDPCLGERRSGWPDFSRGGATLAQLQVQNVSLRFGLALFLCIAEQRSVFWFHSSSGRRRVKSHFFQVLLPTQNFSKFSEVELLSR